MISGFRWKAPMGQGWWARLWQQLTAPMRDAGVKFAVVLGNHDGEADLRRRDVMRDV